MPKNHHNQTGEQTLHLPVLLNEALVYLQPQAGESYLDLTAGRGGHAQAVVDITKAPEKMTLIDRDAEAVDILSSKFPKSDVIHQDFASATEELVSESRRFDMILADLGVSSPHFDNAVRGFAFSKSGPLDMRMDQRQELDAAYLVNNADPEELASIIRKYGEEPRAKAIARKIVENRPIIGTEQLAIVVASAYGKLARRSKIHPATRTFQALRIAVNDELGQLSSSLDHLSKLLAPGGRLAIISFHSLEDRIVKNFLRDNTGDRYDTELRLVNKKPTTATHNEIVLNPRARSAKLRAAVKIKKERKK